MDTPALRILDTVSSNLGEPLSINQLTERIKERHGTAYYANTYQRLQKLKKEGLLSLHPIGRSCTIKLNFQNYLLIDALSEMEMEKKKKLLEHKPTQTLFMAEVDRLLDRTCATRSASSINPTKNIKLNRADLLILLRKTADYHTQVLRLHKEMQKLEKKHNLRINSLIMDTGDFRDLATSDEINPVREALSDQTTFFCPQAFWTEIREIAEKTEIKVLKAQTKPSNVSDSELTSNLNRFGYREVGSQTDQGKRLCIEYTAVALLLRDEERLLSAAPIILAKNSYKSSILTYLSKKYEIHGKLLGLLRQLQTVKPSRETHETIELLETLDTQEIPADRESLLQKMRLYNAL